MQDLGGGLFVFFALKSVFSASLTFQDLKDQDNRERFECLFGNCTADLVLLMQCVVTEKHRIRVPSDGCAHYCPHTHHAGYRAVPLPQTKLALSSEETNPHTQDC